MQYQEKNAKKHLQFFIKEYVKIMSKSCEVCGKGRQVGNNVSHAKNRTKKVWNANTHTLRVVQNGAVKRISVCTKCVKAGNVVKA